MKLGIISDTHDKLSAIKKAIESFHTQKVTMIIHCGDWTLPETATAFAEEAARFSLPVYAVFGNRDILRQEIMEQNNLQSFPINFADSEIYTFEQDAISFAIYHGHHKPTLKKLREDETIDILFTGHTHKPKIERIEQKLIVNPGSTAFSIPRSKNYIPTVAVVDANTNNAKIIKLF